MDTNETKTILYNSSTPDLHCNNSSNLSRSNTGPSDDMMKDYVTLWLELVAFVFIDVIGLIGNTFVIAVVVCVKHMRTSANFLILSLSVADILVCLCVTPMLILTRWKRAWLLGDSACVMQAMVNHTCLFASLFSLAAIAVNRVVVTRSPGKYHALFSTSLSCTYICIIWFISVLYAFFPIMGWGMYTFDHKRWNCIFSRKAAPSYSFFFASCCVILPLVICAMSYLIIWITFYQSKRNLRDFPETAVIGNVSASENRLTKNLFVVWLAFFVCWLPMNVLLFADPKGLLDERVYTMAVWFLLCNSCVNPIIYGVQNRHFRKGYMHIIGNVRCCRHHRISPQPSLPAVTPSLPAVTSSCHDVRNTNLLPQTQQSFITSSTHTLPVPSRAH